MVFGTSVNVKRSPYGNVSPSCGNLTHFCKNLRHGIYHSRNKNVENAGKITLTPLSKALIKQNFKEITDSQWHYMEISHRFHQNRPINMEATGTNPFTTQVSSWLPLTHCT
jgi:hypothetical protein